MIIFSFQSFSKCKLNRDIVSLSGPLSFYLLELGLIDDPKLRAVSLYHDFLHKKFKGRWIGGGIYLSPKEFKKISGEYEIFLDESLEMKKRIDKLKKKVPAVRSAQWIKTRGKSALAIVDELNFLIKENTDGCDEKIAIIKKKISETLTRLMNFKFLPMTHLFYLGVVKDFKNKKIMVANDLFLVNLKKNISFKSYPTSLEYLSPSSKILKSMQGKSIVFGLNSNKKKKFEFINSKKNIYNMFSFGLLSPGLSQIYFISEFLDFYEVALKSKDPTKSK